MKNAIFALIFAASCFAQTTKPAAKPVAQNACQSALKAKSDVAELCMRDRFEARAENERLRAENEKLRADNQALTTKSADAEKKFADLRDAAIPVYNYALQLQGALKQATAENDALTNKYNYLLADAKEQMTRANDALVRMNAQYAKQQRFANALALYNAMPKYQPYVIPQPQNLNINCTSNKVGDFTYTNCH